MIDKDKTYRIMLSGGGTGGHIYPAIAVANALKTILPKVELLFVGAKGKMEMQKVPEAGYPIEGLWISGIQRKLTPANLSFPFKLISSIAKASKLIRKFKPDVVIGFGGYASGALLYVAGKKGIPTIIQEQNSYAGLTNKWLAKSVKKICVAHGGMEKFFPKEKLVVTGNPVRKNISIDENQKQVAFEHFGLNTEKPVVLMIGGSLGARTLNESAIKGFKKFEQSGVQFLWQCGGYYFEEMKSRKGEEGNGICLKDFIKRMDYAYGISDVVISRAGALSIAELMYVAKPTILVPSPNVAEDHQTVNAKALVKNEAAIMIKDSEAAEKLIDTALDLVNNQPMKEKLSANIHAMSHKDAATEIANEAIELIK